MRSQFFRRVLDTDTVRNVCIYINLCIFILFLFSVLLTTEIHIVPPITIVVKNSIILNCRYMRVQHRYLQMRQKFPPKNAYLS
jgi:hypothetical protein